MKRSIVLLLLFVFLSSSAYATMPSTDGGNGRFGKPMALPNTQLWVHDVGKVWMSITNYGFFGSQSGDINEYTGRYLLAPGVEFPGGSNLDYLFQGALWIGAEVDTVDAGGDPIITRLVSIGNDGWWGDLFEMFPAEAPDGGIEVRSLRPSTAYPYGDTTGAISEQDYIAVYADTISNTSIVPQDPNDGRDHIPLGIEITQKSYAWSYEYAEDFVLFDFDIKNIGNRAIRNVWMGMYIDADVWHESDGSSNGAQDDICGFREHYVSPTGDTTIINTAWIADNDGQVDPGTGAFDHSSPRGLSGVRVVRTPSPDVEVAFNWWISNVNAAYDWGPRLEINGSDPFPGGGMGTPGGDSAKYQVMSNGEFDYDQIFCDLDHWQDEGWLPRSGQASDLADGYDTRYLFSFGEFPVIEPGDVLKLTTAYVCGEDLHTIPSNFNMNLNGETGNESRVNAFYANLDFTDFATNSQWADWVYDNPGVDTAEPYADLNENEQWDAGEPYRDYDGDGFYTPADGYIGDPDTHFRITPLGDTFWFKGDGVPDFAGPPPPPSPTLNIETGPGVVNLSWDGSYTERFIDNFLRKHDFEGYRVYMSRTGLLGDYTLLADYDIIDFDFTWLDETVSPPVWKVWKDTPHTLEQLVGVQEDPKDTLPGAPIFPDSLDYIRTFVENPANNWIPYGWNRGLDGLDGFVQGDSLYTFTIDGLSQAISLYFAVSAYDFGNPITGLSSLESSQAINSTQVYPISWGGQDDVVTVYPNPYKSTNIPGYLEQGYEDPDRSGNTQFDRSIKFSGFPEGDGLVRIFTLDGDLVVELPYYESMGGLLDWNVISRNTQAIVSGVYIFQIEMDSGYRQLGKLAIIK